MSQWPAYWQAPERGPYFQRTTSNGQIYRPGVHHVPMAWYGATNLQYPYLYSDSQTMVYPYAMPYQMTTAFPVAHPQYLPAREIQQSESASYKDAKPKEESIHVQPLLPSDALVYYEDFFKKMVTTSQSEHKSVTDAPHRLSQDAFNTDSLPEEMTSVKYEDESVISLLKSMDYFYNVSTYDIVAREEEIEPFKGTFENHPNTEAKQHSRIFTGSTCKQIMQRKTEIKKKPSTSNNSDHNRPYLPISRHPRFFTIKKWKQLAQRRRSLKKHPKKL